MALLSMCLAVAAPAAPGKLPAVDSAAFNAKVKPVLKNICLACHNGSVASGGVNLLPYLEAGTVLDDRASWEKIVLKIETGEMPPIGVPRSQPQMTALVNFLRNEFDKADAASKPDPGRVTAKRLNR